MHQESWNRYRAIVADSVAAAAAASQANQSEQRATPKHLKTLSQALFSGPACLLKCRADLVPLPDRDKRHAGKLPEEILLPRLKEHKEAEDEEVEGSERQEEEE